MTLKIKYKHKNMKQIWLYTICLCLVGLFACQQEDLPLVEETGFLSLENIFVEEANTESNSTRAVDNDLYVEIWDETGTSQVGNTYEPGKIPAKIELEPGNYTLKAYNAAYNASWGNNEKGEAAYYIDEQPFTIEGGKVNYLTVQVPMINVGVLLSLPDDFETYFPTSTFTVTYNDDNGNSRVVVIENGEKAYFPVVTSTSLSYNLQVINTDGEESSSNGNIPKKGEIKTGTIYEINYDYETQTLRVIE